MNLLSRIRAWRTRRRHEKHRRWLREERVTFTQHDYTAARQRALEQLGPRYLCAQPINRRLQR